MLKRCTMRRETKKTWRILNLFFYAPNGKPDAIKIVPLSEVATKDDFFNIKKISAADLLDTQRIPYQLMDVKP
ncbi:phage portal protein, PBSX family [Serratia quinivorans]|nr:phage portal protein, PBSX family [Serratia quinivorans]